MIITDEKLLNANCVPKNVHEGGYMNKNRFPVALLSGVLIGIALSSIGFYSYVIYRRSVLLEKVGRNNMLADKKDPFLEKRKISIVNSIFIQKESILHPISSKEKIDYETIFSGLKSKTNVLTREDVGDLEKGLLLFAEMRLGDSPVTDEKAARIIIYTMEIVIKRHGDS